MSDQQAYDYTARKTVIALASTLDPGVALNVSSHLAISLGAYAPAGLMGRRWITDGSGVEHAGISRYPVIVTKVKQSRLRRLLDEARDIGDADLQVADYPEQMLSTGHDDDLAAALRSVGEADLAYLGVLVHGSADTVTKLTGRFMLWI